MLAPLQVKYDTFVTVSLSHCDFYPRVRAAGFETLDFSEVCTSSHDPWRAWAQHAQLPCPGSLNPGLVQVELDIT